MSLSFMRIVALDGVRIKPGLYDLTTLGETYMVEKFGDVGWYVLGRISSALAA